VRGRAALPLRNSGKIENNEIQKKEHERAQAHQALQSKTEESVKNINTSREAVQAKLS
jgi:hypothetical protein